MVTTSPFWMPVVLIALTIWLHFYYIRAKWLHNKDWVLLEIKLPKQIDKTPQAMEVVTTIFYQTRDHGNLLIDSWIKGEIRTWFSLELASFAGDVHFYIRGDRFFKNM